MKRPDSVQVPDEMSGLFLAAEEVVGRYFRSWKHDAATGTLRFQGERYVLLRAASLSVEFFTLVEELFGEGRTEEAHDFARNLLFDLSHALGKTDARSFHTQMELKDPMAKLSAGPVHFAYTGWSVVRIDASVSPAPDDSYMFLYEHPTSFEADAWLSTDRSSPAPVCIMGAGYSSGWCEESFGIPLVASELLCRACGDSTCRFIMAPPSTIESRISEYTDAHPALVPTHRRYRIPDFFSRKRLEDELRRSRDELEVRVQERTAALQAAYDALQVETRSREQTERRLMQSRKLQALGGLAGGIAHDFNNILTTMAGYCELAMDLLPEEHTAQQYLQEATRATQRATALTRQLMVFSRQKVSQTQTVQLASHVERMHGMLQRLISEHIDLRFVSEGTGWVRIDPSQLEQIVMNLVLNARDAMPSGGALTIRTKQCTLSAEQAQLLELPAGLMLCLQVEDEGEGISAADQEQLFEPFFTTKEIGRGTGLGLATVYAIVHTAGGAIDVDSALGKGSTFSVYLPPVEGPPKEITTAAADPSPTPHYTRLLLVEDDTPVRELLVLNLQQAGWSVRAYDSGSALLADEQDPLAWAEVLLSDVILPGLSGPALAARLQARNPALEVMFMSGYTGTELEQHSLQGSRFIQKPFDLHVLLQRLAAIGDEGAS